MKVDVEERVSRAVELMKSGHNCSQSVVAAFADLYGLSEELALRVASSFGGGIGKMRLTCGAASGMFILAGLECGSVDAKDKAAKAHNYKVVQHLAAEFKAVTGSITCGELLGLKPAYDAEGNRINCTKLPCVELVALASRIFAEYLNSPDAVE